jgi:hypothetical protein
VNDEAHVLLRYLPALGVSIQDYTSGVLIGQFSRDYPELYRSVINRLEPQELHHIEYLTSVADACDEEHP